MKPFLTLHHPARARDYYERGLWRQDTLYDLLAHHAATRPDAPALRDGRRRLSFAEVKSWVDGTAASLREFGLIRGDRVSIWASNRVETVITFLACSREGFACNPSLHRTHSATDVVALMRRLSAKALFTETGFGGGSSETDALLADVETLKVIYRPDSFPKPARVPRAASSDPDQIVYLAFTSGTTGAPKCVMHSDNTLLANARDLVHDWNHGPDTVLLSVSPLSHHIAWVGVAQWLVGGCEFVTDDPRPGTSRIDWLLETGATYVMGVPTHAIDILAEQKARGLDRLGRVAVFYMAGAPIAPALAEAFVKQGIKPQNVYGMTENSSHQYTHPRDDVQTIVDTCGRGGAAYEIATFDQADDNRRLEPGEIGQIGGRGAALMLGYFGNQDVTEKSFNNDGWFLSGDLGVIMPNGALRVEGRLKDLIIRGGHNIYPTHIEALAMRHTGVVKAACFPIPDDRLGERACIAVSGGVEPTDLIEHLKREGLSKYDLPEYFLRIDAFPLTPSGKILKRELVDMVRKGDLKPLNLRTSPAKVPPT